MIPKLKPFIIDPRFKTFDLKYEKTYKIPVNYGIGLKWTDKHGHKFESVATEHLFTESGKRKATLDESNLLFSIGASHYYAKIEAFGPGLKDLTDGSIYSSGGYGPEFDKIQDFLRSIHLEVERRLTKLEKDLNGETIGKIGQWTYRFNSEADARAAALITFPKRFAPGWVLIDGNDCDKILLET